MTGAFGTVTIDGKVWNQIALRPVTPFWKVNIPWDLVFYFDQDGNVYDENWNFSSGEKAKVKLKVKKYNPSTRKHEIFVEKKLPPHSK